MPNEPQSLLDAVLTVRREHEAELLKRETPDAEPDTTEPLAEDGPQSLTMD